MKNGYVKNFLPLSDPSATNSKKSCTELDVLVISPILRNEQGILTDAARRAVNNAHSKKKLTHKVIEGAKYRYVDCYR